MTRGKSIVDRFLVVQELGRVQVNWVLEVEDLVFVQLKVLQVLIETLHTHAQRLVAQIGIETRRPAKEYY